MTLRKKAAGLATAITLAVGMTAAPVAGGQQQQGLVNVNIGDVTILQDVAIGVAANVAANICGVQVNAAVIAEQVVRNQEPLTVCEIGPQAADVTITP
jgi:hypothetical protein